jgi:hypothetical protein
MMTVEGKVHQQPMQKQAPVLIQYTPQQIVENAAAEVEEMQAMEATSNAT